MKKQFLLALIPFLLYAQWTNISGPGNTSITAIAKKGNAIIVATTDQGIHLTSDQGTTWRSINGNLSMFSVQSLLATSTRILAGLDGPSAFITKGLYQSTDNGVSWKKIGSPLPDNIINSIVKVDTVIFAGTNAVFRSIDDGNSWQSSSSGIPAGTKVNSFTKNGSAVFAATDGGIYRSTNLGASWTELRKNVLFTEVSYSISSGNGNVYVANNTGGVNSGKDSIFKSTNNGDTWIKINNNLPAFVYGSYIMGYGDTLFFGMQSATVYRSLNAGQSWQIDSVGMDNPRTRSGLIDGSVIYSGGDFGFTVGTGGLYVSTNNGNNWNRKFSKLHSGSVIGLAQVGSKLFASVSGQKEKGIFVSSDRGGTWNKSSSGLETSFLFSKNGILFCPVSLGGVYASFDTGATWKAMNSGLSATATVNSFYTDADTIYGCMKEGLFRTTNNGTNWQTWGGLPSGAVKSIVIKNDTVYASFGGQFIYRSVNRGRNWISVKTNQTLYYPDQLYVHGSRLLTVTGTGQGKLLWCSDTGATWTEVNTAFGSDVQSVMTLKNNMFVRVATKGMYLSTNSGTTWTQMNQGLSLYTPTLNSLFIASDTLYAGYSGGGIVRRGLIDLGITNVKNNYTTNSTPNDFSLSQNYPNPFNPSTNIEFKIPQNGFVTLKVFDPLGREVATLANDQMNVGSYKTSFNGAGLASGVYFYRLSVGNYSEIKKMMFVK